MTDETDEIDWSDYKPVAICVLCKGPIGQGEPVICYDDGLAHRFVKTCDDCREDIAEYDRNFMNAMRIEVEDA